MPTSNIACAPTIVSLLVHAALDQQRPVRVLDVGPGHGKFGLLAREYLGPRLVGVDAVEAELRYGTMFPWTAAIYDTIWWQPAESLTADDLAAYEVVLMVDVIEHLAKGAAVEFIGRCPGHVVICTPRDWFQNPEADGGWESERHRSLWAAEDFLDLGRPVHVEVGARDSLGAVIVMLGPR